MQTAEQGALMGAILGQVAGVDAATMQEMQRAGAIPASLGHFSTERFDVPQVA